MPGTWILGLPSFVILAITIASPKQTVDAHVCQDAFKEPC